MAAAFRPTVHPQRLICPRHAQIYTQQCQYRYAATNRRQQVDRDVFIKVLQRWFICDSYENTPGILSNCIVEHATMFAPPCFMLSSFYPAPALIPSIPTRKWYIMINPRKSVAPCKCES